MWLNQNSRLETPNAKNAAADPIGIRYQYHQCNTQRKFHAHGHVSIGTAKNSAAKTDNNPKHRKP